MINNLYYYLSLAQCEIGADTIIDENHLYAGVEGHLVVLQGVGAFTVRSTVVVLTVIEAGARRDVIGNLWVEVFQSGKSCKNDTFYSTKKFKLTIFQQNYTDSW